MFSLLLLAIILWLMQPLAIKKLDPQSNLERSNQIDYYIKTFTARIFQKDGTLDLSLIHI